MRTSSISFLLLLAGLVVGGGLGFVFGSGGGGPVSAAPPVRDDGSAAERVSRPSTRAAERDVDLGPELASTSGPESRGSAPRPAASDARASGTARSVAGRVDGSAAFESEHSGVIEGTVLDEDGLPLEGASVVSLGRARWYDAEVSAQTTSGVGRAWSAPKSLEEELETYAKRRARERAERVPVTTDAEGRFRLEGLEAGTHTIQAYFEGYVFKSTRLEVGEPGTISGTRVGEYTIDVVNSTGEPVDEAVVMVLQDDDDETPYAWKREDPVVRLSSRTSRIRVLAGKVIAYEYQKHTAPLASAPRLVDLDRDGEGPHVFELLPVDQLQITVVDATSDGPRMKPWVRVKEAGSEGNGRKLVRRRGGPYVALGLTPGTYEVTAGRSSQEPEVTEVVEVTSGLSELALELPEINASDFVIAKCTTSSGKPVAGVRFRYTTKRGGGSSSGGADGKLRGPGEYWIAGSEFLDNGDITNVEGLEFWLTATSSQMGAIEKQVELDGKPVEFTFGEPCSLEVMVSGAKGAKYRLSVTPRKDGAEQRSYGWGRNSKEVPASGKLSYGYLQPGPVRIQLMPIVEDEWRPPVETLDVDLPSGPHAINLSVPEMHDLVIHAPDLAQGSHVQISRTDGDSNWNHYGGKQVGDDQRARFSGLPAGRYMVTSWGGSGQRQMEVDVPCGEVLLEEMEIYGYEVSALVDGKLAARAGLVQGDVIVAVEGREAKDQTFMQRLWLELADGETTVVIDRGGSRRTLTIEAVPEGKFAWQEIGAALQPRSR